MLVQQVINGLTNGSIYALIAVGISMVFKSLGMLNMAHGDTVMAATYVGLLVYRANAPLWVALLAAIVTMTLFGFGLERFIYRRLNYGSFVNLLIATIGVSIVLRNTANLFFNAQAQRFPEIFSTRPINVGNFRITPSTFYVIGVGIIIMILLNLFYRITKTGKLMRAAASDPTAAYMMGIDVDMMRMLTFGISFLIASVAGLLMAPTYLVRSSLAAAAVNKGFASAILGGLGDISGAIIGGIAMGIIEALASAYISSSYRDVIAFAVMFLVLAILPHGLFGKRIEQKL